jgi:hypothetical protein
VHLKLEIVQDSLGSMVVFVLEMYCNYRFVVR